MNDELDTPPKMPTAVFKRATPDESINLDPEQFEKARVSGNKIDFDCTIITIVLSCRCCNNIIFLKVFKTFYTSIYSQTFKPGLVSFC